MTILGTEDARDQDLAKGHTYPWGQQTTEIPPFASQGLGGHPGGMHWHTVEDAGDDANNNDFGDVSSILLPKTMATTDVFVHNGSSATVNVYLGTSSRRS